jgi:hypothetical protein
VAVTVKVAGPLSRLTDRDDGDIANPKSYAGSTVNTTCKERICAPLAFTVIEKFPIPTPIAVDGVIVIVTLVICVGTNVGGEKLTVDPDG